MALEEGAVLVQLSRALFLAFLASRPNALQIYLQQGVARLWRVANHLINYLNLPTPLSAPSPTATPSWELARRMSDVSPTRHSPPGAAVYNNAGPSSGPEILDSTAHHMEEHQVRSTQLHSSGLEL